MTTSGDMFQKFFKLLCIVYAINAFGREIFDFGGYINLTWMSFRFPNLLTLYFLMLTFPLRQLLMFSHEMHFQLPTIQLTRQRSVHNPVTYFSGKFILPSSKIRYTSREFG
jgi:hypothetical protein